METIHQRIKAARTKKDLSMEQLADMVGVKSWQTIQQWENGKTAPKRNRLELVAKALSVSVGYLLQGDNSQPARSIIKNKLLARPNHVVLSVLDVSPSAGTGSTPVDHPAVIDYLEVPAAWAKYKLGKDLSKYRLLPVSGDSMSPTINDGDIAFVDTGVITFEAEGIYVIIWNDRLLIKRLRVVLASKRVEICSDNKDGYSTETVSMDELSGLHICGLVKCWWSIKSA